MATYKELKEQAEALLRQAEEARHLEIVAQIAEIRARMAEYGITVRDLGRTTIKPVRMASTSLPKYRDPLSGATWSGRGRAPKWMVGQRKEEFLIRD